MHTIARLATILAVTLATLLLPSGARQGATSTDDVALSFPEGVTVTATFPASEVADDSISLLWRPEYGATETLAPATLELSGESTTATVSLDLQREFTPVGITIEYRWVTGTSPFSPLSDASSFAWHDTRWDWTSVTEGSVSVHTYGNGSADGQSVLRSATSTLEAIETRYGIGLNRPVAIWVYPTMTDFAGTLQSNSREAIAGVAYPDVGVISSILPVGQPAEIDRVIPHEITHQVLAQATQNSWNYPPVWFDEGLAVYLQSGGTASYERILENAVQDEALFSLDALGHAFPYPPKEAALAYAQSWSVVSWLHQTYGDDGVAALIEAFASGASWDAAMETALGIDLETLERNWRSSLEPRAEITDARLITDTNHDDCPGGTAGCVAPLQEGPLWPLTRISNIDRASSIRLRSSANWR